MNSKPSDHHAGNTDRCAKAPVRHPDLAHLRPDTLTIGGVAVFSGDWENIGDTTTGYVLEHGYIGTLIDWWNGWAVFACTREVAAAIVAQQQRYRATIRADLQAGASDDPDDDLEARVDDVAPAMWFDGDDLITGYRDGDQRTEERSLPRPDGRYVVNGWNWCWEAVDPASCIEIIGVPPGPDRRQEFILLPHSGLRVPHDQLTVVGLNCRAFGPGAAYRADLAIDGALAGTITDPGDGSGPVVRWTDTMFSPTGFDTYVAECWSGAVQPSAAQVLHALAEEHYIGQLAANVRQAGAELARLRRTDGTTIGHVPVYPTGRGIRARDADAAELRRRHPHPDGVAWEWWTGQRWQWLGHGDHHTWPTSP